jgi:hypothetical protein
MLRKADLGVFKTEIGPLGDNAKLRLQGGKLTTAERSIGGRILRFFSGVTKQDRQDNHQIKGQLFKALQAKYGDDLATQAFRTALGKDVKVKDGAMLIGTNSRLTVRQVRTAVDTAEKLVANNRTRSSVLANSYTPGTAKFDALAYAAGVNPTKLSGDQQTFIQDRVAGLVDQLSHTSRYADGLIDKAEIKKIAKDVTRQAVELGDDGIAELAGTYDEAATSGAELMSAVGNRSAGADEVVGSLATATRDVHELPSKDSYFGKGEGAGTDDFKAAINISMTQAAGKAEPEDAATGYKAAMAPDGQGRALVFALSALNELPGIGTDGYAVGALTKMSDTGRQSLAALGRQGGQHVDQEEFQAIESSAEKVTWSRDGTTLTIPPDVLKRAGISDERQVQELIGPLRAEMAKMGREIAADEVLMHEAIARQKEEEALV